MRKLIGKIRRQSKQRRDNIAFGIAVSFTVVVVAIWMFNVPNTFSNVFSAKDSADDEKERFFDTLSSQAAAVKESFSEGNSSTTEPFKELMDEYRASSPPASSTQLTPAKASSTASTTPADPRESREQFTPGSSYEFKSETPREVRIQTVAKSTTSTTTNE
jgi:hypothetical protein